MFNQITAMKKPVRRLVGKEESKEAPQRNVAS